MTPEHVFSSRRRKHLREAFCKIVWIATYRSPAFKQDTISLVTIGRECNTHFIREMKIVINTTVLSDLNFLRGGRGAGKPTCAIMAKTFFSLRSCQTKYEGKERHPYLF